MITLPEDRSMPLYQALYLQLRQQIQSGALPYGKKLPSKRKLSEQLGISVNTVDSAYCQLEAEGFIQSSPRRGFFVLDAGMLPQTKVPAPVQPSQPAASAPKGTVDVSPSGMARQQFPFGVWRKLKGLFPVFVGGDVLIDGHIAGAHGHIAVVRLLEGDVEDHGALCRLVGGIGVEITEAVGDKAVFRASVGLCDLLKAHTAHQMGMGADDYVHAVLHQ